MEDQNNAQVELPETHDEEKSKETIAELTAEETAGEVVPVVIDRDWGETFSELENVLKDEVMPLNMETAENLLFELQILQQRFAQPPVSVSSALSAGRNFFSSLAMEIPSISDALLEENGLEPRPKFKRPRSLKPGQTEDPDRKLAPIGGAWTSEPHDEEATPESAYRTGLEKSVASKFAEMIPSFVENAIASEQEKIVEERRLRNMELSLLEFSWTNQIQDEDEDDGDDGEEERE